MAKKTHVYRGRRILPCAWLDSIRAGSRWYVEVECWDRLVLDERYSPRFAALADARRWIDEDNAHYGELETEADRSWRSNCSAQAPRSSDLTEDRDG